MKSRTLLILSFLIAALLVGAIFYPGALTKPYSGMSEDYSIAHESSEAFNETVNEKDLSTSNALSVEELSERELRAFEDAKDQTPEEDSYGPDGWQSLGDPLVCDNTLLLCNEYEEMPHPSSGVYTFVEDSTGDLYLLRVGLDTPGPEWNGIENIVELVTKITILGPYALFLGYRVWTNNPPHPTHSSVGYGLALVGAVFAYPYLLMFTDVSFPSWHLPALAVITWAVIAAEIWRGRSKKEAEGVQSKGA